MKLFANLYAELDATTRTNEKIAALARYFRQADPGDAAWALYFLSGRRFRRAVSSGQMVAWATEEAGLPGWIFDECRAAVGDTSETISLLLPAASERRDIPLHEIVDERIKPLRLLDDARRKSLITKTWRELDPPQRFIYHKLLAGEFRVGVQRRLIVRALAQATAAEGGETDGAAAAAGGLDPAVIEHRLIGPWEPTAASFASIISRDGHEQDPARPYPFFLASQLDDDPASLGGLSEWLAEWKWDGIRAQLIRRSGRAMLWSRGEEILNDSFPELVHIGDLLADGTVIDGEVLAWDAAPPLPRPLPFSELQRRINRKQREVMLFDDVPVVFQAYDLLECEGADWRERPLAARRTMLENIVNPLIGQAPIRLSPIIEARDWGELAALREEARRRGVEGVMLKRRESPYRVGRVRGDWWKWKIQPFTIDAVLIGALPGSGKRASLYTDYTFGVWDGDELVPVAKAYSGLTDEEIARVDRFIRANTLERHGPMRTVKPELVFELAFEAINESPRHKSGVAVRFPRISRWRTDKKAAEADTMIQVRALLHAFGGGRGGRT